MHKRLKHPNVYQIKQIRHQKRKVKSKLFDIHQLYSEI